MKRKKWKKISEQKVSARNDEEWIWRVEKNLKTFLMIKIWSLNTMSGEKNTGAGGLHWSGYVGKGQQQD